MLVINQLPSSLLCQQLNLRLTQQSSDNIHIIIYQYIYVYVCMLYIYIYIKSNLEGRSYWYFCAQYTGTEIAFTLYIYLFYLRKRKEKKTLLI